MKLELSELASVAEIVASIGVILTLIFVGLELSEGNRETRAATTQLVIKAEMDMVAIYIENSATWDKVVTGAPIAAGDEMRKAINLYQLSMLESANKFAQFNAGFIDLKTWEGTLKALPGMKKLPIYENWRMSFGARGHDTDFLKLLDSLSTDN